MPPLEGGGETFPCYWSVIEENVCRDSERRYILVCYNSFMFVCPFVSFFPFIYSSIKTAVHHSLRRGTYSCQLSLLVILWKAVFLYSPSLCGSLWYLRQNYYGVKQVSSRFTTTVEWLFSLSTSPQRPLLLLPLLLLIWAKCADKRMKPQLTIMLWEINPSCPLLLITTSQNCQLYIFTHIHTLM